MHRRQPFIVTVSIILSLSAAAPTPAGEGGASGRKENLDLPLDAGGIENPVEDPSAIVVLYGQQFEGDGIFFSCDRSGSMKVEGKWRRLQEEVLSNITRFSDGVQFGIIFFDAGVVKFPASGVPAEATPAAKGAAKAMVLATSPGSGSCVKAGLFAALDFAERSSARRKVIIHVADGFTTCPGHADAAYGRQTLQDVTRRNASRAKINAICIGPPAGVDEAWMRELAARNGGSFARIVQP